LNSLTIDLFFLSWSYSCLPYAGVISTTRLRGILIFLNVICWPNFFFVTYYWTNFLCIIYNLTTTQDFRNVLTSSLVQHLKWSYPWKPCDNSRNFGVKILESDEVCFLSISQKYSAFVNSEMIGDLQIFKSRKTLIGRNS
jgi:hypothetical protein